MLTLQATINDWLDIDGLISEGNSTESSVTTAPIEDGFSVADGVVNKPQTLRLECLTQDFMHSTDATGNDGKALDVVRRMRDWQTTGTKLDVYTDGPSFLQYVITSVGYTRTTKATSLKVSVAMQAIHTVTTKWVAGVKVNKVKTVTEAAPKVDTKQESGTASAPVKSSVSLLKGLRK